MVRLAGLRTRLVAGVATAAILLLAGCSSTGGVTDPSVNRFPHVKRPNLVVSDIDRSLRIYRDVLGLQAGAVAESSDDSFSYPVFAIPAGTPIRTVALSEHAEQRVLALTELRTLDLPRPSGAPHMSAVVVGISNLAEAFDQLESMGLAVTESKVAEGVDFTFIEQAFVDFDGHLIVCYEVLTQ